MLKLIVWKDLGKVERESVLQRPAMSNQVELLAGTQAIINKVREQGDVALRELTQKYDGVNLESFLVTEAEFIEAEKQLDEVSKTAITNAARQIETFHAAQIPHSVMVTERVGIICEMQFRPIQRVGFYIPGGTARLPSTVLMLGVPAKIANCPERILCTPPMANGKVDPHILYAAKRCHINKVYKVGGAQAIAAMAYGTESVPKVDKIFGPGNSWVTQAKVLVAQDPYGAAYDMPAGPSEQMVIADETANPDYVAADLLSQAEHSVDAQVVLVTTSLHMAEQVNMAIDRQMTSLPRTDIIKKSLAQSCAILVDNIDVAIAVANQYAPEHLLLQFKNARNYVPQIQCAGSVFIGQWAPESVGDYASGTNHVLPTYGYARSFSGLGLADFFKRITFQELTFAGLQSIAPTVMQLAQIEGLTAHRQAVAIRLQENNDESTDRTSASGNTRYDTV